MDNAQLLSDRVDAGIAWADENLYGWREAIDLDVLNMAYGDLCIIGQFWNKDHGTHGNMEGYYLGVNDYAPVSFFQDYNEASHWVTDHGFTAAYAPYTHDELTEKWKYKLTDTNNN